jgi:hypothetical protein
MTPVYDGNSNGWEVNPIPGNEQGFDSRAVGPVASRVPSLPYAGQPGQSIVKAISRDPGEHQSDRCGPSGSDRSCIAYVSVLTILDKVPADNGATLFRPPYTGTWKPFFSVNDLQWDLLPSLDPVPGVPTLDWVVSKFSVVQMDHMEVIADQYIYPKGVPSYSASRSTAVSDAVLRLFLNDTKEEKKAALIAMVQGGIDLFGIMKAGSVWNGQGGHGNARKLPITLAAMMLNNAEMKDSVSNSHKGHLFNEDVMLYYSAKANDGKGMALYGSTLNSTQVSEYEDNYWKNVLYDQGNRLIRDPYEYIDGGLIPGGSYQYCCNSMPWKYTALAANLIPGMRTIWNHEPFFEYADRWVNHGAWTLPDPCRKLTDNEYNASDFGCKSGTARFAAQHGVGKNAGGRSSTFGDFMWKLYRDYLAPVFDNHTLRQINIDIPIKIYPQPVACSQYLNIEISPNYPHKTATVVNLGGIEVAQLKSLNNKYLWKNNNNRPGIYYFCCGQIVQKIVILR